MRNLCSSMWVKRCFIVAGLALLAVPVSRLMAPAVSTAETATEVISASEGSAANGGSAAAALMSGSVVGADRGADFNPRHPATAYVP